MANGLIQISLVLLLVVVVLSRSIDNKIYNPDEFEHIQKSLGTKKPTNIEPKTIHKHHHAASKKQDYENIGVNATTTNIEDRFMVDAPCRDGFVQIGDTCIKTTKMKNK